MCDDHEDLAMSLARSQADVKSKEEEAQRATEIIRILQKANARMTREIRNVERDLTNQKTNHRLYVVRQVIMRRQLTAIYEHQAQQLYKENERLKAAADEARDAWDDIKYEYDDLKKYLATLENAQSTPAIVNDATRRSEEQKLQPLSFTI